MITIVTLVDNELVETYVNAVQGSLSEEERLAIARAFGATYGNDADESDDEDRRDIYFREVEPAKDASSLRDVLNASDQGMGGVVRAEPL